MSEGAANPGPAHVRSWWRFSADLQPVDRLAAPRFRGVEASFQNGDLRRYLLYILIANVAAMLLFVCGEVTIMEDNCHAADRSH